jgi:methionyl-tRNA formyltransferase
MKIAFFGTGSFALPILKCLISNFEVVQVFTAPVETDPKKDSLPGKVKAVALEHDIPLMELKTPLGTEVVAQLVNQEVELTVLASFGLILPSLILKTPAYGSINVHPSLLPKYRGPSPIQSSIMSGDKETGVTVILMEEKVDAGKIIAQIKTKISESDTSESLTNKLSQNISKHLPEVLSDWLIGKVKPRKQDNRKATYTKKLLKKSGFIDWQKPPDNLNRRIRAYYPWPTVWTLYRGKILKILPNSTVQLEGKRPISLKSFYQGHPDFKLSW